MNKDRIKIARLHEKNGFSKQTLQSNRMDVSWSKFVTQLEYKAECYRKIIRKVDTFYASTQTCHCCGYKNEETIDLKVREWTCPKWQRCKCCH